MVRLGGLEPPHLSAQPPQGCVSTIPPQSQYILWFFQFYKNQLFFKQAKYEFNIKQAIVIGPTPLGTGVILLFLIYF